MKTKLLILLKNIDGGTGTYLEGLLDLRKLFKDNELEIKVLVLERPSYRTVGIGSYTFFPTKKHYPDKYSPSVSNISRFLKETVWFKNEVKNFDPNVVISSDSHSILLSEIVKLFFNKKYNSISVIHNNLKRVIDFRFSEYPHLPIKLFLSFFLNRSGSVITVSTELSRNVYSFLGLKRMPKTIPGILPSRVRFRKPKFGISKEKIIITIARMDYQKDHKTLLRAFKIVSRSLPNTKLWLVGDGPLASKLKLLVKRLGISDKTKFLGWVQNPEKLLDKSDLFVLSTHWEGFPLTVLEAMMRGVPVIVSDCQYGPSEIIGKDEYGVLTPPGDVDYLANTIINVLSSPEKLKYYAIAGQKRSGEFSRNLMLSKYKKLIGPEYQ